MRTHTHRVSAHIRSLHTHTHAHAEKYIAPFCVFSWLALCAAATYYRWLPTANSKVSLSFDLLICIGSLLSQHGSGYQCPQAECQRLFSAYKYPPDVACHVYSWTSVTFANTLWYFTIRISNCVFFNQIPPHVYQICPLALKIAPCTWKTLSEMINDITMNFLHNKILN